MYIPVIVYKFLMHSHTFVTLPKQKVLPAKHSVSLPFIKSPFTKSALKLKHLSQCFKHSVFLFNMNDEQLRRKWIVGSKQPSGK